MAEFLTRPAGARAQPGVWQSPRCEQTSPVSIHLHHLRVLCGHQVVLLCLRTRDTVLGFLGLRWWQLVALSVPEVSDSQLPCRV